MHTNIDMYMSCLRQAHRVPPRHTWPRAAARRGFSEFLTALFVHQVSCPQVVPNFTTRRAHCETTILSPRTLTLLTRGCCCSACDGRLRHGACHDLRCCAARQSSVTGHAGHRSCWSSVRAVIHQRLVFGIKVSTTSNHKQPPHHTEQPRMAGKIILGFFLIL